MNVKINVFLIKMKPNDVFFDRYFLEIVDTYKSGCFFLSIKGIYIYELKIEMHGSRYIL